MKDQFVKRFESLSEDFIYYMRSVEHLKDNTVQNYISWLKFLSESYPIDEKIEEKDIIKILEQEKKSCLERNKYKTPKSISDFKSALNKFHLFLASRNNEENILYQIQNDLTLNSTEKEMIIQARVGQGKFRSDLISYWKGCSITNCTEIDLLAASHIKPWKYSTNAERLDVYNGLLLLPNYDKLFDRGYLTFTPEGKVLYSQRLSSLSLKILGLTEDLCLRRIEEAHKPYLEYHNKHCFIEK